MTNDFQVTIQRKVNASQKELFEAWLNVDAIKEFMIPMPGTTIENVNIDKREGGLFSLTMKIGDTEIPITGEYKKIIKFESLEFSWLSPQTSDKSLININFKKLNDSETEITLLHKGLETEESMKNHEGGWIAILDNLSQMF